MSHAMANGHSNWLVAGGILAVGVSSAMLFREQPEADAPIPSSPPAMWPNDAELPWYGEPLTLRVPGQEETHAAPAPEARTLESLPRLEPTVPALPQAPPRMPDSYGSLLRSFDGRDGSGEPAALPRTGGPRSHVIRDGDTLKTIARRYYHDTEAAALIFAANRSVLQDPNLLPVGTTLILPDVDGSPAEPGISPVRTRLVPVAP